jgi:hypothetical protein
MQRTSGMIAVLLLVVTAAAVPGAHALAFLTTQPGHPAGCHNDGPATPAPAPNCLQCCVSGHQAAMPNASFSSLPLDARPCGLAADEPLCPGFVLDPPSVTFVVPSNSPPGAAPLRI